MCDCFMRLVKYFMMLMVLSVVMTYGNDSKIQKDLNIYFVKLSESFDQITNSQSLKDRNLSKAEKLFVREMKKNLAYNTFIRINSKGQIISEAIRGSKIERSLRDVSDQTWFKEVKSKDELYSTLIKDEEKGRYYLLWAKPIHNSKGTFIGAIVTKIDLWDCFYDYSNSVYYPFLIKLNRMQFFVHKWKDDFMGHEDTISVLGAKRVSVSYIPEQKPATVDSISKTQAAPVVDSNTTKKKDENVSNVKKQKSSTTLLVIILLIVAAVIGGWVFLARVRQKLIQRKIDRGEF